ncbi:MAG: hypothetical protein QOI60_1047 [Actinomycetota bacterium]|nr:hypothetical protein [Actinomycetota bacterium]
MLRKTLASLVTLAVAGALTLGVASSAVASPACFVTNGVTTYSDLQTGLDDAAIGDTLTVDGVCAGPFTVSKSVTVNGSGYGTAMLTVYEGGTVLTVNDGSTFIGTAFTVSGGFGADGSDGGAGINTPDGTDGTDGLAGGIQNYGETDLSGVLVTQNVGGDAGNGGNGDSESGIGGSGGMGGAGGIQSSGILVLLQTTVDGNTGGQGGNTGSGVGPGLAGVGGTGGVSEYYTGGAGGEGFGPPFPGAFIALQSTFSGNTGLHSGAGASWTYRATDGAGGVSQSAPGSGLIDSTISGNTGEDAYSLVSADGGLTNTTIAQNVGVGIHVYQRAEAPFSMEGNLIAENSSSGVADCRVEAGASVSEDHHNFFGTGCQGHVPDATDLQGNVDVPLDPMIGSLAANGGPTLTHALLTGSPAIDAAASWCEGFSTDQRGMPAPSGPACDMGSFEVQAAPIMRPDAMVSLGGLTKGDNVYGPNAAGQTLVGKIGPHQTRTFTFTFQNDGGSTDTFRLSGPGSTSLVTATYLGGVEGLTDITDQVVAGTFTTDALDQGASYTVRLSLHAGAVSTRTIQKWQMKARSLTDTTKADAARAVAKLLPGAQVFGAPIRRAAVSQTPSFGLAQIRAIHRIFG